MKRWIKIYPIAGAPADQGQPTGNHDTAKKKVVRSNIGTNIVFVPSSSSVREKKGLMGEFSCIKNRVISLFFSRRVEGEKNNASLGLLKDNSYNQFVATQPPHEPQTPQENAMRDLDHAD